MSQQKRNLLIIIQHLCRGGAEKCAANLSNLLQNEYNVHIITFFSEELYETSYTYSGSLHCLNQPLPESRLQKIKNSVNRIAFLRKFKKQHNIDISVSYLFSADIVNILSKRKDKTIVAISTFLSANDALSNKKSWIKTFYGKADLLVALNERGRRDMIDNFNVNADKIHVIPNFYEIKKIHEKYDEEVPEWENTEKYFKFIQVGRLYYPKGQWHLFRIFKQVVEKVPHAKLAIAGIGEMEDLLTEYADTLGLRVQNLINSEEKQPDFEHHDVVLLGFISNPFRYVKASQAFLFTSVYEGFPNALAEAMICGSTVFSTDCTTGPRELIAPDTDTNASIEYPFHTPYGVLFPAFDGKIIDADEPLLEAEKLWIDSIAAYTKQPETIDKKGENAKSRMKEFDKEEVKNAWIKLLENA